MTHHRSKLIGSFLTALRLAAGSWLLAGCSLITGFERERDAAGEEPDIEEHDAASTPTDDGDEVDAGRDEEPPPAADSAVDTEVDASDAGAVTPPDPVVDAGAEPAQDAGPAADPGAGQAPDAGAPSEPPDAAAPRPSVRDLIDEVGGARDGRTQRICACPGAGQECVRAGFGKSSCLERGLMLLAGASEESVRSLLECMLPAEKAYTECVQSRLSCRSVETSTAACGLEYELATARCNVGSIQGLSLQGLCSRSGR